MPKDREHRKQVTADRLASLQDRLREPNCIVVAVSGGGDSMTLAVVPHRILRPRAHEYHCTSPTVQADATERVHAFARRARCGP